MNELSSHIDQIIKACISNRVKSLFVFGSVITDKFRSDSDIDMIVEFYDTDPFRYSDHYFSLKEKLERILGRSIDLLEAKAVRNPVLKDQIDQTKVLLYAA